MDLLEVLVTNADIVGGVINMLVNEYYASSAVDINLAAGKDWAKSPRARKITRMALHGGAAVLDAAVDVFYGTEKIAHLINFSTAGATKPVWIWHTSMLICPPDTPISVVVTDAFAATKTILSLDIKEL